MGLGLKVQITVHTLSAGRQEVACRSQENECTYSCWLTFLTIAEK